MFEVKEVMNREKVAATIHAMLDAGVDLINKKTLDKDDYGKIKVLRTMGSNINAAVTMVQQETAQQRNMLISERMKQLGYDTNSKAIEG